MSWPKLDIIGAALAEIGLGGYVFDATPQEKQDALSRLDALMARWEEDGIVTGYTVENGPAVDTITGDSGIAQQYVRAVFLNLAVEIAPSYGKQVMQQTLKAASEAYTRARSGQTPPIKAVNVTAVPPGAGHKETGVYIEGTPQPQDDTSGNWEEVQW